MKEYTFTQDRPNASDTTVLRSVRNDDVFNFIVLGVKGDRGVLLTAQTYEVGPLYERGDRHGA